MSLRRTHHGGHRQNCWKCHGHRSKDTPDALGELRKFLPKVVLTKTKAEVVQEALGNIQRPIVVIVFFWDLPIEAIRSVA